MYLLVIEVLFFDSVALNFFNQLYAESLARFQGGSPYIYPLYGLGELPQVFLLIHASFRWLNYFDVSGLSLNLFLLLLVSGICKT